MIEHDPDEFRDRLEDIYEAAGSPKARDGYGDLDGMITWAAERFDVQRMTVQRWLMNQDRDDARSPTPAGMVYRRLRELEDRYGVDQKEAPA